MHCELFKIYCAPPNLGITRTWICGLNFAQRPIFSGLRFFNEPEISDSGPPAQSPSRRTCAQDFYVLKKSIDLSREPWISRRALYPETTEYNTIQYNTIQYNTNPHSKTVELPEYFITSLFSTEIHLVERELILKIIIWKFLRKNILQWKSPLVDNLVKELEERRLDITDRRTPAAVAWKMAISCKGIAGRREKKLFIYFCHISIHKRQRTILASFLTGEFNHNSRLTIPREFLFLKTSISWDLVKLYTCHMKIDAFSVGISDPSTAQS